MNLQFSICLVGVVLLLISSCAIPPQDNKKDETSAGTSRMEQSFALPQQKAPPQQIQNIQLHPQEKPGLPPILNLDSQQLLVLSFDLLSEQTQQFRIEVSHRSRDWQPSSIGPSTYLDSFFQTYIQNSKESISTQPAYQHFEYTFPNNQLRPVVSGNYLLQIYKYQGNDLLFSMPFFVSEEKGSVESRIKILFAKRKDGRTLAQLFSSYHYPNFVEFPQFDLSISYVQNQFWGRMKKAGYLDTITPGSLSGYLEQDQAFIANYEFKMLDLSTFDADGRQILEYQPGTTPPRITLRRDVQNLDTNAPLFPGSELGIPVDKRSNRYAQVAFFLETDFSISPSSDIYIVGDFNNWIINRLNKMTYDSIEKIWEGEAFIKQGKYTYKYVLVEQNTINDLALDQGFLSSQQEYLTLVYFKDPERNYDRLLKTERMISR